MEWRLNGTMVLQWGWKWQVATKVCFVFVVKGMNWRETTTVRCLWLVVKDKGYHRDRLDRVDDTVAAAAAEAGKVAVAGFVRPKVI